jgi:hypothetical protein
MLQADNDLQNLCGLLQAAVSDSMTTTHPGLFMCPQLLMLTPLLQAMVALLGLMLMPLHASGEVVLLKHVSGDDKCWVVQRLVCQQDCC